MEICKAAESVESQNRALYPENTVDKTKYQRPRGRRVNQKKKLFSPGMKQCKFCGGRHKLRKEECPAYQKTCRKCGEKNHFECCCASMKGNKQKTQKKYVPARHAAGIIRPTNIILKIWSHTHLSPLGVCRKMSAIPGTGRNTVSNV